MLPGGRSQIFFQRKDLYNRFEEFPRKMKFIQLIFIQKEARHMSEDNRNDGNGKWL
jgi:hypothetical protein